MEKIFFFQKDNEKDGWIIFPYILGEAWGQLPQRGMLEPANGLNF